MPDFLSEASFHALKLPTDRLNHERLAKNTLRWALTLPPRSVIALQGGGGRGKTDVLARIMQFTRLDSPPPGITEPAFWLNPWPYATTNPLTPLVQAMASRAAAKGFDPDSLRAISAQLIQAGTRFGLEASGSVVPSEESLKLPNPMGGDPVGQVAANFRTLAQALRPAEGAGVDGRILVLVDDLDRCPPERQVALLQALRFLISGGAPVTVIAALDPVLARQGVLAAHRNQTVDPDLYLDKMFDLRVNLGPIDQDQLRALIDGLLQRPVVVSNRERPLSTVLPRGWEPMAIAAPGALPVQSLRTPRVVRRIVDKLWLLARSNRLHSPETPAELKLALQFMGIAERWPMLREALFERGHHLGLERLINHYTGQRSDPTLPDDPDLERLFADIAQRKSSAAAVYPGVHQLLVEAGF